MHPSAASFQRNYRLDRNELYRFTIRHRNALLCCVWDITTCLARREMKHTLTPSQSFIAIHPSFWCGWEGDLKPQPHLSAAFNDDLAAIQQLLWCVNVCLYLYLFFLAVGTNSMTLTNQPQRHAVEHPQICWWQAQHAKGPGNWPSTSWPVVQECLVAYRFA